MVGVIVLITAFAMDSLLGDPRWLPHLIVGYGKLIAFGENHLNKGKARFRKGMFLTLFLVLGVALLSALVMYFVGAFLPWGVTVATGSILLFYCLANRTLIREGIAVFRALDVSLEKGRKRLSWIVGRETKNLNEQQIRMATFETMSENLSDGVMAPLFFFLIAGIPGALAYKMINTLDSMIGYRNERYEEFGKFAAHLDDVVNYIPARITAFLILLVSGKLHGISWVFSEGKRHKSPNAGYPEAALAFVLDCRFGGPNYYHGQLVKKPFIGKNDRAILSSEINHVANINWASTVVFVVIVAVFKWCLW